MPVTQHYNCLMRMFEKDKKLLHFGCIPLVTEVRANERKSTEGTKRDSFSPFSGLPPISPEFIPGQVNTGNDTFQPPSNAQLSNAGVVQLSALQFLLFLNRV